MEIGVCRANVEQGVGDRHTAALDTTRSKP
jgi:hypothetical protein